MQVLNKYNSLKGHHCPFHDHPVWTTDNAFGIYIKQMTEGSRHEGHFNCSESLSFADRNFLLIRSQTVALLSIVCLMHGSNAVVNPPESSLYHLSEMSRNQYTYVLLLFVASVNYLKQLRQVCPNCFFRSDTNEESPSSTVKEKKEKRISSFWRIERI